MISLQRIATIPFLFLSLLLLLGSDPTRAQTASQWLKAHNGARKASGLPPLVWDKRLEAFAQRYANKRRGDCKKIHSDSPYGENLFWGAGNRWTAAQAVSKWLSERKWYNYKANRCFGPECGHYTQVVWRSTQRVGCARASCLKSPGLFFVCEYDPPGNWDGLRPF